MPVSAGYMRKRFKLMGVARDSGGSIITDAVGQMTTERKELAKPWCSVKVISSTENNSGTATKSQLTLEFTVRWNKSLSNPTPDMSIIYGDATFDIVSVVNPLMRKEKLIVTAIKRG